jgi:hypothetical protein
MTRIPTRHPDWQRHLFPCDCGGSHWLLIEWWNDEDDPPYLEITDTRWAGTLLGRIKGASQVLLGRPHYNAGVILTPEVVAQLTTLINDQAHKDT